MCWPRAHPGQRSQGRSQLPPITPESRDAVQLQSPPQPLSFQFPSLPIPWTKEHSIKYVNKQQKGTFWEMGKRGIILLHVVPSD